MRIIKSIVKILEKRSYFLILFTAIVATFLSTLPFESEEGREYLVKDVSVFWLISLKVFKAVVFVGALVLPTKLQGKNYLVEKLHQTIIIFGSIFYFYMLIKHFIGIDSWSHWAQILFDLFLILIGVVMVLKIVSVYKLYRKKQE